MTSKVGDEVYILLSLLSSWTLKSWQTKSICSSIQSFIGMNLFDLLYSLLKRFSQTGSNLLLFVRCQLVSLSCSLHYMISKLCFNWVGCNLPFIQLKGCFFKFFHHNSSSKQTQVSSSFCTSSVNR